MVPMKHKGKRYEIGTIVRLSEEYGDALQDKSLVERMQEISQAPELPAVQKISEEQTKEKLSWKRGREKK